MRFVKYLVFALIGGVIVYFLVGAIMGAMSQPQAVQPAAVQEDPSAQETAETTDDVLNPVRGGLAANKYTPETYVAPQYDPFSSKFGDNSAFREQVANVVSYNNVTPAARMTVRTAQSGLADLKSGTVGTEFVFSAYGSTDPETSSSRLRARWDFENDGTFDTYFSTRKTARHTFKQPGVYTVLGEVLDENGGLARTIDQVTVVENTEPFAAFSFSPTIGTTGEIFTFQTGSSDDSQYRSNVLKYRFDWNGDGVFDTNFSSKTSWRHQFTEPGLYSVILEVRDPEGLSSYAQASVEVTQNIPPTASFTYTTQEVAGSNGSVKTRYRFDASGSIDAEKPKKLQYRWDFNYTGPNDINFTTGWNSSSQYSGYYEFPGGKMVRLQVRDADGTVREVIRAL